jgi:hypothetical protein
MWAKQKPTKQTPPLSSFPLLLPLTLCKVILAALVAESVSRQSMKA